MTIKKEILLVFFAFMIFIFMTYFPGLILYPLFSDRYHSYFSYEGSALESFLVVFIIFIFVFIISYSVLSWFPRLKVFCFSSRLSKLFFIFIAFVFLLSSIYFFMKFSISFRHKNRLSDAGLIVIVMFFIKYLVLVYTYMCFSVLAKGGVLARSAKFTLFVMLVAWVLSVNSSLQVIYIFIVLVILFRPAIFSSASVLGVRKMILYGFVGVLCFSLILIIGIGNKVGLAFLFTDEGVGFLKGYVSTVAARGSTSLYSLATAYELYFFNPEIAFHLTYVEFSTFINRLSLYFPFGQFDPDKIETVSRFNYLMSFSNHADRAGGTPGFLATVILSGGFPLGFIVMSLYLFFIVRLMSRHLEGVTHFRLSNIVVMCYFLLPFMENPLSLTNLLNPASFYFLSFFLIVHLFEPHRFLLDRRALS